MNDDALRLARQYESQQAGRVGNHDRPDLTRLFTPGVSPAIIRLAQQDLQNENLLTGPRSTVRPSLIQNLFSGTYHSLDISATQNAGVLGQTTTWKDSSHHDQNYGRAVDGYWQGGYNLWPSPQMGLGAADVAYGVALDRTIDVVATLNLLDKDGNVLTTAQMSLHEHDTYDPQFTYPIQGQIYNRDVNWAVVWGQEAIDTFCALRATVAGTPACPQTPSDSSYFTVANISWNLIYISNGLFLSDGNMRG